MVLPPEGGSRGENMKGQQRQGPDRHEGAVEGDRPTDDPQFGNANAPALDSQGLPDDCDKVDEDRLGANLDDTQG
ncbi:MAG TPA: hypothetical protein VL225_10300 [Vicinamibacterales bacterium]|nr:hypothetical protein [Vicinamibacterales bacterium]